MLLIEPEMLKPPPTNIFPSGCCTITEAVPLSITAFTFVLKLASIVPSWATLKFNEIKKKNKYILFRLIVVKYLS